MKCGRTERVPLEPSIVGSAVQAGGPSLQLFREMIPVGSEREEIGRCLAQQFGIVRALQAGQPEREIARPDGHGHPVLGQCSERVGGRLFPVTPPGMPHLHAELGGMRYLNNQPVIADLVDHLGFGYGSVEA